MLAVAKPWFYRGPRPGSLSELRFFGVETVISLESGFYEFFHQDTYEKEYPSDYGLRHFQIRCSPVFPPNEDEVNKVLEILSRHNTTYMHCKSGVDRTGFMVAVYRMQKEGWTYEKAYQEWKDRGRHWWFDWWSTALKTWEL
jgi:protein-tyrosine phosphatase